MDPRIAEILAQLNIIKNAKHTRDLAEAQALEANKTSGSSVATTSTSNPDPSISLPESTPIRVNIPENTLTTGPNVTSADVPPPSPIDISSPVISERPEARETSSRKHKHHKDKPEKTKHKSHREKRAAEEPVMMCTLPAQHSSRSSVKRLARKTVRDIPEPEPKKRRTEKKETPEPEVMTEKIKSPEQIKISKPSEEELSAELLTKLSGQSVPSPEHEDDPYRKIMEEGVREHRSEKSKEDILSKLKEGFGSDIEAGEITVSPPKVDNISILVHESISSITPESTADMVQIGVTPPSIEPIPSSSHQVTPTTSRTPLIIQKISTASDIPPKPSSDSQTGKGAPKKSTPSEKQPSKTLPVETPPPRLEKQSARSSSQKTLLSDDNQTTQPPPQPEKQITQPPPQTEKQISQPSPRQEKQSDPQPEKQPTQPPPQKDKQSAQPPPEQDKQSAQPPPVQGASSTQPEGQSLHQTGSWPPPLYGVRPGTVKLGDKDYIPIPYRPRTWAEYKAAGGAPETLEGMFRELEITRKSSSDAVNKMHKDLYYESEKRRKMIASVDQIRKDYGYDHTAIKELQAALNNVTSQQVKDSESYDRKIDDVIRQMTWLSNEWTHYIQSRDQTRTAAPSTTAARDITPAGAPTAATFAQHISSTSYNDGFEEALIQAARHGLLHEDIFNSPMIIPSIFKRIEELRQAFYSSGGGSSSRKRFRS